MAFTLDIVEIWQFFAKNSLHLGLLKYILLLEPHPLRIYLTNILNNEWVLFNSIDSFAEYSKAFGVHSEEYFMFFRTHTDSFLELDSKFFVLFSESRDVKLNEI